MSKNRADSSFNQWIQYLGSLVTGVVGFITMIVGFIQLVRGSGGLVTLLLLALGISLLWLMCLYFVRFWRPEQQDETPKGFYTEPTERQIDIQARREKRRYIVRRYALVGLMLVPILTISGYFTWQRVEGLPGGNVVLIAEFDGPEKQNYRVTETILNQLREQTKDRSDIDIVALGDSITEQDGSKIAREIGEQRDALVVIWGWYGKTENAVPISINFEVLKKPRNLPTLGDSTNGEVQIFPLVELDSFNLQAELSSELSYLTLFTLGMVAYELEDWTESISLFNQSLSQINDSKESLSLETVLFYKGNAHLNSQDFKTAIETYDKAISLNSGHSQTLFNKSFALSSLGLHEEAVFEYDKVLQIQPNSYKALNNRGVELYRLGKIEEAYSSYEAVLDIDDNHPEIWVNIGNLLDNIGKKEDALQAMNTSLSIRPTVAAFNNKGNILGDLGRNTEALRAFKEALNINPDSYEAHNNRGNLLVKLGRNRNALSAYNSAITINPDSYKALSNKSVLLGRLEQYEESLKYADEAVEANPSSHEALSSRGAALFELGRYKEALSDASLALEIKPDDYVSLIMKTRILSITKSYENALTVYESAIKVYPEDDEFLYGKASTLEFLDRYEDSLLAYERALEVRPNKVSSLTGKGSVLIMLGEYEKSLETLEVAIALDPDYEPALMLRTIILDELAR